jgi:CDGSH-type Zn-finger protein
MSEPGSEPQPRIVVETNGPYRVEGNVRILRTAIVKTERGEPVAWEEGPDFKRRKTALLCRCGKSSNKPFCDSTHETWAFDGTETADRGPIAERAGAWQGQDGVVLYDDESLCTHAGFCKTVSRGVWDMIADPDPAVREEGRAMIRRCPSGRLAFAVEPDPQPVETGFEPSIGIEPNASLWIRGNIPVVSEDGTPYEVRNRQTLCRCGHSRNKPFCDASHAMHLFHDRAMPPEA